MIIQEVVFEMRCGMNEFDHRILALVEHCTGNEGKVYSLKKLW